MIADIWTVIWKEWRELLFQRGSWRAIMLMLLPSVMLFGIILPRSSGRFWLESLLPLGLWGWLPLLPVTAVIADAFAGGGGTPWRLCWLAPYQNKQFYLVRSLRWWATLGY